MILRNVSRMRVARAVVSGVMLVSTTVCSYAYQMGERIAQAAGPNIEASVITKFNCVDRDESRQDYWIYQYTARPPGRAAFRVILPPNWSQPIGGRDLAAWQDAEKVVLQACKKCQINPDENAVTAKGAMDNAYRRWTQTQDATAYNEYVCHKAVLDYLQRTTR